MLSRDELKAIEADVANWPAPSPEKIATLRQLVGPALAQAYATRQAPSPRRRAS